MVRDRFYIPGTFYRISDRSGLKTRSFDTEKQWNNLYVRKAREFEPRQPQDFVRGVADEQAAPEPRPRPPNLFQGPVITTLSADVAAGATSAAVASSVGMTAGDTVEIFLATNNTARVLLSGVPDGTTIQFATTPLPFAVLSGAQVTDISAVSEPDPADYPANTG